MKEEIFPINETIAKRLGDLCAKSFSKKQKDEEKTIYVNFSMVRLQTCFILPKLIYAKGIEEKTKSKTVVMTWRPNRRFETFLDGMGIKSLSLEENLRKHPFCGLKAFCKTMAVLIFYSTGERVKKIQVSGLPIGGAIYEDIIRTSEFSTIRSVRNRIGIKKIFHILWMLYALELYIRKNPPLYFIADDLAYHEGAMIQLFHKYHACIRNSSWEAEETIRFKPNGLIVRRGEMANERVRMKMKQVGEDILPAAEEMISDRLAGRTGRDIDRQAFKDKEVLSREELQERMGLDKNKKTVVIMAHTFTDAVFNYGDLYFRDYYDWLEQTLRIAGEVTEVNWILKPHPSRKLYHESKDSLEDMFERYRKDHIFLLDDSISTGSIRNIADVILTIGGNAGGEFACLGIPAIIAGKAYYSGFGYTIEPKDREEYEKALRNVSSVERLCEDQIETAKKVFYLMFSHKCNDMRYKDEFSGYVLELYRQFSEESRRNLFESDHGTEEMNDHITGKIIDYLESHDIKDCEYYKRGLLRGEELNREE